MYFCTEHFKSNLLSHIGGSSVELVEHHFEHHFNNILHVIPLSTEFLWSSKGSSTSSSKLGVITATLVNKCGLVCLNRTVISYHTCMLFFIVYDYFGKLGVYSSSVTEPTLMCILLLIKPQRMREGLQYSAVAGWLYVILLRSLTSADRLLKPKF